jgi:adenosine deaminase
MRRTAIIIWLATLVIGAAIIRLLPPESAQTEPQSVTLEQKTQRYLESIRNRPAELLAFLKKMPKGGDLHSHLSGAVYAETFIKWAVEAQMCIDPETLKLSKATDKCESGQIKLQGELAQNDSALYNRMIDAWSVRNWERSGKSGHDQFFGTFDKFSPVTGRFGEMEAEVRSRAATEQVSYLELMLTPETVSKELGDSLQKIWNPDDLAGMRNILLKSGLIEKAVQMGRQTLAQTEKDAKAALQCDRPVADAGCHVKVRYIFQVGRSNPPGKVFAQMLTAFEMASVEPRLVGLNLVQPEDNLVAMDDFKLHMRMLEYLHAIYSRVHITLHAGELTSKLVPPEGLRTHINESVEIGHAERIGHGADLIQENDYPKLLQEMAERNVMVEICLTSNDVILTLSGDRHPLRKYIEKGVPVALATDDEGVARSDMTHEYLKAVEDQQLDYPQLKKMARASLEHSFIEGASLWQNEKNFELNSQCQTNAWPQCQQFIQRSEKAWLQWQLEEAFVRFERQFQ